MTKIKGQIYVPNKDNPVSEEDYDLILPQTTIDMVEGKATKEDAEAGTDDIKFMSPLRVWDAIKKYMITFLATAVFTGIIKAVAPAADSNDDSVPTTSWVLAVLQKIFREHIVKDYSMEQNGYIQGGDWVGGLILQWGIKTEPYGLVTFPISFQTCFGVITHFNSDPTSSAETSSVTKFSNTDFYVVFYLNNTGANAAGSKVFWVAIGSS